MTKRKTYTGIITDLKQNQIFVFGSNPEGRHGAGAAKLAMEKFGAVRGVGRGLTGRSYALVTKNLTKGFRERSTGKTYALSGKKSVSKRDIKQNIRDLYRFARKERSKEFLIAYTAGGLNLNGYTSLEMAKMFGEASVSIPENIIFQDKFLENVEKSGGN